MKTKITSGTMFEELKSRALEDHTVEDGINVSLTEALDGTSFSVYARGSVGPETLNRVSAELEVSFVPNPRSRVQENQADLNLRLIVKPCFAVYTSADAIALGRAILRLGDIVGAFESRASRVMIMIPDRDPPAHTEAEMIAATKTWAAIGKKVRVRGQRGIYTVVFHYDDVPGGVKIDHDNHKGLPEAYNVDALEPT